jgi:hypothetical protein
MKIRTQNRKMLLAKFIELQVTYVCSDITFIFGKPLSHWNYNAIADGCISILEDTDYTDGIIEDEDRADIYEMARLATK